MILCCFCRHAKSIEHLNTLTRLIFKRRSCDAATYMYVAVDRSAYKYRHTLLVGHYLCLWPLIENENVLRKQASSINSLLKPSVGTLAGEERSKISFYHKTRNYSPLNISQKTIYKNSCRRRFPILSSVKLHSDKIF